MKTWKCLSCSVVEQSDSYEPCLIIVSFLNDLLLNIIDVININ